jgi:hypothetical protein
VTEPKIPGEGKPYKMVEPGEAYPINSPNVPEATRCPCIDECDPEFWGDESFVCQGLPS